MSGPIRRFDPTELTVPGDPAPPLSEQADALLAARELETLAASEPIRPTEGFEDRVMAAIAGEPAPRLAVRPASAVRGGRVGAFLLAVREAWGVASTGGRPIAVRAQALAFVLLVVVAAGAMTTVAATGVGGLLDGNRGTTPTSAPAPTGPPTSTRRPEPTETPEATETAEPTETPEETETAEPTETPEATETAEPDETPRATRKPRATETPEPGETPEPNETDEPSDDHGGGGGGGGGGPGPG